MKTIGRGFIAATAVMAAVIVVVPGTAQAAVTIGQAPPASGTPQFNCSSQGQTLSAMQLANTSGNSYEVPAGGGVITSWRSTIIGAGILKLRVFTAASNASSVTAVAESEPFNLDLEFGANKPQPTRIPVSGGEHIGFSLNTPSSAGCLTSDNAETDIIIGTVAGPVGQPEAPVGQGGFGPTILANISAELEPDADKDGYGDETQDLCPTNAMTQVACGGIDVGKAKANAKKGTAKVAVTVPGPGILKLSGKTIAAQTKQAAGPGSVTLVLRPKGTAKKKLAQKGKLKVKAEVAFTPDGGSEPLVETIKAKLKKG